MDLPKLVRQTIYRLHLVKNDPINVDQDLEMASYRITDAYFRRTLPILAVSKKIESEAAPIYYGENHFKFEPVLTICGMRSRTYLRHFRLIRRVTCAWEGYAAHEGFAAIAKIKNLQELYIRVDEALMTRLAGGSRIRGRWGVGLSDKDPSPQEQLAIRRFPGYTKLLEISGVAHVEFIKTVNWRKEEVGGPVNGGFLQTEVLPKLMGRKTAVTYVG